MYKYIKNNHIMSRKKYIQLEMFESDIKTACFTDATELENFMNDKNINVLYHESSCGLSNKHVFKGMVKYEQLSKETACKPLSYNCKTCDYRVKCVNNGCTSEMCNIDKRCFQGYENASKCPLIELKRKEN